MKPLIISILVLVLSGPVFADQDQDTLRCNPTSGHWSYEPPENTLKPNPVTGQWTHEDPESRLRCNPTDGTWGYTE